MKVSRILLCLAALTMGFGCDDGGGPSDEMGMTDGGALPSDAAMDSMDGAPSPEDLWTSLEGCGLTGRFVATTAAWEGDSCGSNSLPQDGQMLLIELDGDTPRLKAGQLNLALTPGSADCEFAISTCTSNPESGTFDDLSGTLRKVGESISIDLGASRIRNFRPEPCGTALIQAMPQVVQGCGLEGRYTVDDATLVEGACDLTWNTATVTIEDATFAWSVSDYDIVSTDQSTCSLIANEGGFLIYNGVQRTVRVEAVVDGDELTVRIEDQLSEPDQIGNACPGAVFTATGRRQLPDADPQPDNCEPLPYVCGDGVCATDAGENCRNCMEDCGCDDPQTCQVLTRPGAEPSERNWTCTQPCSGGEACPAGTQCAVAAEFNMFEELAWCLPSDGEAAPGASCMDSLGCEAGLLCSEGVCRAECAEPRDPACERCDRFPGGRLACVPRCGPEAPDVCGEGHCTEVVNQGCASTNGQPGTCYPSRTEYLCRAEPAPEFGEPCKANGCALGFACVGEICGQTENSCEQELCSRTCETDDDCEAPLPHCWQPMFGDTSFCLTAPPGE